MSNRLSLFSTATSVPSPINTNSPNPRYSLPSTLSHSTPPQSKRTSSYLSTQPPVNGAASSFASGAYTNILDRSINKTRGAEVGMAAWAFLFAEIVSYSQSRVNSVTDLEGRLAALGHQAGRRIISLQLLRTAQTPGMKDPKKDHRLIPILQYVHTHIYRYCFGKPADGLEKSVGDEGDEYQLIQNQPTLTQYISIPKDLSQLSCEAFTAGIVEGVLDGLEVPARVTAHTVPTDQYPQRTVILIKLDQSVVDREEGLGKI